MQADHEKPEGIVLTDAPDHPRSARCPRCGAGAEHRIPSGNFGPVQTALCRKCGHEFKEAP
jgi:rubredoxin